MKKILLINGNPKQSSLCHSLCDHYETSANTHGNVRRYNLSAMDFNADLTFGYDHILTLEPCLQDFTDALLWADHIVMIAPIWWGGIPSKLKGLLDRTFLPGTTFKFEGDNPFPTPLLKGKTGRIVLTMDTPHELLQQQAQPVLLQLGRYTLEYCGVKLNGVNLFGSVIASDIKQKADWFETIKRLGLDCD